MVFSGEMVSTTSFISLEDSNTVLYIAGVVISRKTNNHVKKQEILITLFEKQIYCSILAHCKSTIFSETYQYSTQWTQVCKLNGLFSLHLNDEYNH